MLPRIVIGQTDAVNIRIVDGGAVVAVGTVEGIVGANLEGSSTSTQPLVRDAMEWEGDGLAASSNSLSTDTLTLLVDKPESFRTLLVGSPHVKVDGLHPSLGTTKWRSLHIHVAEHPVWKFPLPSTDVVPSRRSSRFSITEMTARMCRVLLHHAKIDKLLQVESNLKDRLSKTSKSPRMPSDISSSTCSVQHWLSERLLRTNFSRKLDSADETTLRQRIEARRQ